jgi:ubiquinone biosynthesis protein COQ4
MPKSTFSSLSSFPPTSFGRHYHDFMSSHGFDPHHRPTVKYVDDADLAYILLRYRESHDFYHTIYNLPPTVLGEIVLKYIELLEFKLGGAGLQAIVGSISLLDDGERKELMESYIPWVLKNFGDRRRLASGASLLEVFCEEELEEDIGERSAALKNLGNNSNQSLSLLISPPSQMPCAHD